MRLLGLGLCFGVWMYAVHGSALAAVPPDQQMAIRTVIQAQEDAFKRDDAAAAFKLCSPGIQEQFGTPETFLAMVRSQYEAVYRPSLIKFLDAAEVQGKVVQRVIYIGPDGLQVLAVYPMIQLPDGSWRTDGCFLVPMESDSA